jgi:hypothetical protein
VCVSDNISSDFVLHAPRGSSSLVAFRLSPSLSLSLSLSLALHFFLLLLPLQETV